VIELEQVTKSYDGGESFAAAAVALSIAEGELLVLLGESGCGKTTTLKMINRLIEPTAGQIRVAGEDIRAQDPIALRRRIGYVFQEVGLFSHMTVGENIAVVPRLLRWPGGEIEKRVEELMELVNLPPATLRDRWPTSLSGGQQQRVGVARALAARPRIMLMDEPFGALDPLTRAALQEEFLQLHRRLGLTTVMVTHDMTEALLLADRIAVMQGGRVLQIGTPAELMRRPADGYVAALMRTPRDQADRVEALLKDGP